MSCVKPKRVKKGFSGARGDFQHQPTQPHTHSKENRLESRKMTWSGIAAALTLLFVMGGIGVGSIYHYYRYERQPRVPKQPDGDY